MPTYQFECPHGHTFDALVPMSERHEPLMCEEPDCWEAAHMVIAHSNPGALLDHGAGRNRENAMAGKYDPLNPNRRFMAKGRGWRK